MVQKSISISVIAAVVVAGILTLSVLAAISSTNQAFANTSTSLSLGAFPNKGKVGSAGTLPVSLSGHSRGEWLVVAYQVTSKNNINNVLN